QRVAAEQHLKRPVTAFDGQTTDDWSTNAELEDRLSNNTGAICHGPGSVSNLVITCRSRQCDVAFIMPCREASHERRSRIYRPGRSVRALDIARQRWRSSKRIRSTGVVDDCRQAPGFYVAWRKLTSDFCGHD